MTDYGIVYVNEHRPTTVNQKYRTVAAADTIELDDFVIDCTTGTWALTLPPCAKCFGYTFLVKNSGTGTITLTANGTDAPLVTDVAVETLHVAHIMSGGTFWYIHAEAMA